MFHGVSVCLYLEPCWSCSWVQLACQPLYLLGHLSLGSEAATFTITGAPPTSPPPTPPPVAIQTNLGTDCDSAIPLVLACLAASTTPPVGT